MNDDDRLSYRPAEAARLLGCSRETVFALIGRGELPSFRIGAARFIERHALLDFIARKRKEERR